MRSLNFLHQSEPSYYPEQVVNIFAFYGFLDDEDISRLIIEIARNPTDDDYFYDAKTGILKPYVFYMRTEVEHKGQGIAGRLIQDANEWVKEKFSSRLYSSMRQNYPARRVWEKLVEDGKAFVTSYEGRERFCMF